jgi:hypothetical protein
LRGKCTRLKRRERAGIDIAGGIEETEPVVQSIILASAGLLIFDREADKVLRRLAILPVLCDERHAFAAMQLQRERRVAVRAFYLEQSPSPNVRSKPATKSKRKASTLPKPKIPPTTTPNPPMFMDMQPRALNVGVAGLLGSRPLFRADLAHDHRSRSDLMGGRSFQLKICHEAPRRIKRLDRFGTAMLTERLHYFSVARFTGLGNSLRENKLDLW